MTLNTFRERLTRRGSQSTERCYAVAVQRFAKTQGYENPESLVQAIQSGKLEPHKALDEFVGSMVKDNLAPRSTLTYLAAAKKFLALEGIELSESKLKLIEKPRNYVRSMDRAPSHEELRRIYYSATHLSVKVMIAMFASSGMRLGELLNLRIGDLDFSKNPTHVRLYAAETKARQGRLVFLSDEATKLLKEYLGPRIANKREYVFPGEEGPSKHVAKISVYKSMMNAIGKAKLKELDRSETRYTLHPHSFRKFFFTQMLRAVGREFAEAFLGHKLFLDAAYQRFTEDELAEAYLKGMKSVSFTEVQVAPEQLQSEVQRLRSELEQHKAKAEAQVQERKEWAFEDDVWNRLREDPEVQRVLKGLLARKVKELGLKA